MIGARELEAARVRLAFGWPNAERSLPDMLRRHDVDSLAVSHEYAQVAIALGLTAHEDASRAFMVGLLIGAAVGPPTTEGPS